MFSFFKRKPSPPTEPTFKERVHQFWEWYTIVAGRFYQVIEAKNSPNLGKEVSENVDRLIPGFAWVFGPGENGVGHSFTLTAEGDLHRQFLTRYWLSRAPQLEGWTFYAARQPGSLRGHRMKMDNREFDPIEFWVAPQIIHEKEKIDLIAWHPMFDSMEKDFRWTVLFLWLDELLGEYGVQRWLGEIKIEPGHLADSMPLEEFGEYFARVKSEQGWVECPPGDAASVFSLEEPHNKFLRGDIVTGVSTHPRLFEEYLDAEGEMKDPLAGTGADFVFVAFDSGILPRGEEANARGRIEDALDDALQSAASGRLLGGAFGVNNSYIDLLLVDGSKSLDVVRHTLRKQGVPAGSSINYFAKEKRGHRVLI